MYSRKEQVVRGCLIHRKARIENSGSDVDGATRWRKWFENFSNRYDDNPCTPYSFRVNRKWRKWGVMDRNRDDH